LRRKDVIVDISGDKTPVRRVYLKRLSRKDYTGIWTAAEYHLIAGSPDLRVVFGLV